MIIHKKYLVIGIIFLFFGANIITGNSVDIRKNSVIILDGITWYVDDDSVCPGNGTLDWPYCKIQYAVNNASENDTIIVANGTYYENIIISTKGVSLEWYGNDIIGHNTGQPIIDGGKLSDVVKIFADNVKMSKFTILNSGDLNFGVNILAGSVTIFNCDIVDNYNGIQLLRPECNFCTINGCTIHNNTMSGIFLFDMCSENKIINCQITNNRWGIWVLESFYHFIQENFISENNIGVVLQGVNSYNIDVFRCIFKKNKIGLWLYGGANRNFIHYCDFIDNTNKYGPLSFLNGFPGTKGAWSMHALFTMCSKQTWDHNFWSPRPFLQNTNQPYLIWGTIYPLWIEFFPVAWCPQIPWINVDMNTRTTPLSN